MLVILAIRNIFAIKIILTQDAIGGEQELLVLFLARGNKCYHLGITTQSASHLASLGVD